MTKRLSSFEGIELTSNDQNVITNIVTTSGDPSIIGLAAPTGSLALSTNGKTYLKNNILDTDWVVVSEIALNNLTNVTTQSVASGETLIYNNITSQWENAPLQVSGSGRLLQVLFGPIAPQSGTVVIPITTASPLITEGVQVWSQTITPTSTTSTIRIGTSILIAGSNASRSFVFVVFRNNVCIGASAESIANKDFPQPLSCTLYDSPNTTTPITYSARVGWESNGGSWYVNNIPGFAFGSEFAGAFTNNAYTVEEISNA